VLATGAEFEGYVVDGVLGRGGHGVVYRAHPVAPRTGPAGVALKVLETGERDPDRLALLQREYQLAARLDHPHVVRMYASGPGWLAMELLTGGPVTGLPGPAERVAALAQIADALDHAHRCGIVHCDVKPANILLAAPGRPVRAVLIDFGVAHEVWEFVRTDGVEVSRRPVPVQASLPYTAPELLLGQAPSAASDQYALACTLVEVLTGAPPFTGASQTELMEAHLTQPPPQLSVRDDRLPRALDTAVGRALAKEPELRHPDCAELLAQVSRALR